MNASDGGPLKGASLISTGYPAEATANERPKEE